MCYVKYLAGYGLSLLKHKGWLDSQRLEELPDRWGLEGPGLVDLLCQFSRLRLVSTEA